MFRRNKNSEYSDPSLMSDLSGHATAQGYGQEPLAGSFAGGGNIYWETVEDPEIVRRGLPFKRIGADGRCTYHTADEYQSALEIADEDLLKEGGYHRDERLERLERIMGHSGNGQSASRYDKDDNFEIEIDKIEGVKIKGKGTLARILQGDTVAPQPSMLDQLIMQRMVGGAPILGNSFPTAEIEGPHWSSDAELTSQQIDQTLYGSGEWGGVIDVEVDEPIERSSWEDETAEPMAPEPVETSTVSRQSGRQTAADSKADVQETALPYLFGEQADSRKKKMALNAARWLCRRHTLKLGAAYLIVMAGPSIVHNGVPHSLHEAAFDSVLVFPQVIHDVVHLKGLLPG